MADLIANRPEFIQSGVTGSFTALGLNATKVRKIYEAPLIAGGTFKSFNPLTPINSLTGLTMGSYYLVYPKTNFSIQSLEGGGPQAVFTNNIFLP